MTAVAFSCSCAVTFATLPLIIRLEPFSPPSVEVMGEPSHKLEMWVEFEKLWAAFSCQLSSEHSIDRPSPSSTSAALCCPASSECAAPAVVPSCPGSVRAHGLQE